MKTVSLRDLRKWLVRFDPADRRLDARLDLSGTDFGAIVFKIELARADERDQERAAAKDERAVSNFYS